MCSVPTWATFGLSGSDPELNLRERPAEPGREADQREGWESGCGSLRMKSPPPSLGLGWPEDVPWRQNEPRTHVVPLAGAAAFCPGHAPLPRASGGPGDIPLGWLRALLCLNRVGSRVAAGSCCLGRAGRPLAAGTRGRLGAGRPGSPAHRRRKPRQGVSSEGLCSVFQLLEETTPATGDSIVLREAPIHFLAWVLSVPPGSCVLSSEASWAQSQ